MNKQEFIDKASSFTYKDSDNPIVKEIIENGISIQRDFFKQKDYSEVIKFSKYVEESIKLDGSGYIYNVDGYPYLDKQLDSQNKLYNDGQIRLQSKTVGMIPGTELLVRDSRILSVFHGIYHNYLCIDRQTLEWIIPAEINHNPWHIDSPLDELKAMILLSPVDKTDAPLYYAIGSHNYRTDIEKEIKYRMYSRGYEVNPNTKKHYGYLEKEETEKVLKDYTIVEGTGQPGDVIFFLTNGFHSGNKSTGRIRKDIVMSTTIGITEKNKALRK